MDGRVKTLHPRVHGGLLGRRGTDDAVMEKHDIPRIDLLAVNLYPFAATVAKPDCTYADAIENIDIGGPAMVRAASKNHESVTVIVDPADYARVLADLDANAGATSIDTRSSLAAKAFAHTAKYDTMVVGVPARPRGRATANLFRRPCRWCTKSSRTCAMAKTRTSGPRSIASPAPGFLRRDRAHAPGQGTVVQQHRRYRHRDRMRARVQRARLRHREARQPLRRGHGRVAGRCLRSRVSHRSHLRVRRHHRPQSRAR